MPNWTNALPHEQTKQGYDLKRTPPDKPIRAIVTSDQFHVCWTHFWGGRTRPCEKPECQACEAMSPSRAHCYLSAMDPATRYHFIFECTAAAAWPFEEWITTYATLRGCYFQASRPKRRRNSPVEIITKPIDLTKILLPPAPQIPLAMAVIWQIPATAVHPGPTSHSAPEIDVDRHQVDRMRLNAADYAATSPPTNGNGSR